jgi:quercetin dioxygenase-like cupin family protein
MVKERGMDTKEFETRLKQGGYLDVETKKAAPNFTSKPHTHEFDVWALILSGELKLTREGKSDTYRAGQTFEMTAGCLHTEDYGPHGTTYLVGRRHNGTK